MLSTRSRAANDSLIYFKSFKGIPVVQGVINGKKAFLIIDSGASLSYLDINQSVSYGFHFNDSDIQVAGYGGTQNLSNAYGVILTINGRRIMTAFMCKDISNIVDLIQVHENIKIAGIIGTDVLENNNVVIDYKKRTIKIE